MIWYPCGGAQTFWTLARTNVEQRRRTHLGLGLPLPVGQDLPEWRPDVERVQLERRYKLLPTAESPSETSAGARGRPCTTWQKWTALQGVPLASSSGENAIRPRTPGTTASREPRLLHTAGTDVCKGRKLTSDQILFMTQTGARFPTTESDSSTPPAAITGTTTVAVKYCKGFTISLFLFNSILQPGPCTGRCWNSPSSLPPASWTACSVSPPATAPGHLTGDRGHHWLRKQPAQLQTHR